MQILSTVRISHGRYGRHSTSLRLEKTNHMSDCDRYPEGSKDEHNTASSLKEITDWEGKRDTCTQFFVFLKQNDMEHKI